MGRKREPRQVDAVAQEAGMTPEQRRAFGAYLEECKAEGDYSTHRRGLYNGGTPGEGPRVPGGVTVPATTDLTPPATGTDPAGLENYLLQLLGQPFAFARTSYGDEVVLHLGPVRDRPLGRFGPKPFGAIQVGLRGSRWVRRGTGSVTAPDAGAVPPDLIAPGVRLTDASLFPAKYGYGLELEFADGDVVVVIPTPPESGDGPDPADWEVLTPAGLLTAGPGHRWSWAPPAEG